MGLGVLSILIVGRFGPAEVPFDAIASSNPEPAEVRDSAEPSDAGCNDQSLRNGFQLPPNPDLYIRMNPSTAWGTAEMIDLVIDTAVRMRTLLPESSPLVVGDISLQRGGRLPPHKTHRGGIDVDFSLYQTGAWQDPRGIVAFPPDALDVAANWTLVSTLLQSGMVDMILLDSAIISRIRTWAVTSGQLSPAEAARIFPVQGSRGEWENVGIVRHAPGHTGHMHVRVLCGDASRAR